MIHCFGYNITELYLACGKMIDEKIECVVNTIVKTIKIGRNLNHSYTCSHFLFVFVIFLTAEMP